MCGLVGALYKKGSFNQESGIKLKDALDFLSYRGPDGSSVYTDNEKIWLGHRRLSIIDLSNRALQPMQLRCQKTDKKLVIVFNGEIYNYKNLVEQLRLLGHTFHTSSDTEAILHSFEEWGSSCFEKLRGMFALAIWDEQERKLILSRDKFGIKPLYYCQTDQALFFSSEIKPLLSLTGVKKEVNPLAVNMFLQQGWIAQPHTFYQNVFALESGTVMIVDANSYTNVCECYANIAESFRQPQEEIGLEAAIKKTRATLFDSVAAHLVADVEVGAFLSGGIDSSALVALMREVKQEKIKTVSAVFPGTNYDESEKSKLVAEKFKTNHLELKITGKDFIEHLDNIFIHMDQPTVDGVNTYFVSWAAKQAGLKVVLSGLGGDELFFGYPSFVGVPRLIENERRLKWPVTRKVFEFLFNLQPFNQRIAKLDSLAQATSDLPFALHSYLVYRGLFVQKQLEKILSPEFQGAVFGSHSSQILTQDEFNPAAYSQFLKNLRISQMQTQELISYLEFSLYMRNQLLRDSDVFSMAHSLELRVPFVDSVLLEAVAKLPTEYKLKNGIKKFLLIKAVEDLLPAEVLQQKKQGFVLPIDLWLKNEAKSLLEAELLNSKIFNQETIKIVLSKFFAGHVHWSRIWSLFVLNRFLNRELTSL